MIGRGKRLQRELSHALRLNELPLILPLTAERCYLYGSISAIVFLIQYLSKLKDPARGDVQVSRVCTSISVLPGDP